MITQAYFQNIRKHIKDEISTATSSIHVAVAWFTDKYLFKILCDKANEGLNVQLIVMDDNITRNCAISYNELEECGGKLYQINDNIGTLMHNKFCIIDEKSIITGSYNWSMKAATNHENITITNDAKALALTFIGEFKRIKEAYHGKDLLKEIDHTILNKRLYVIDSLIQLEDYNDILPHIIKLNEFELPITIKKIIAELENKKWYSAGNQIKEYIKINQSLIVYDDVKVETLKWQIKYLEVEIIALENEKTILIKIISDFVHTYTIRFGKILSKILKLKKEKLQTERNERQKEYERAEKAYQNFEKDFYKEKEKDFTYLNDEDKELLKKKYRKAASMCHPDVITNLFPNDIEKQRKAEELFKILNESNTKNDLNSVSQILSNLEKGIFDFQQIENQNSLKIEELEARLTYLKEKIEILKSEITNLHLDKTYKKIIIIDDFELFYKEEEERLNTELNNIEKQLY